MRFEVNKRVMNDLMRYTHLYLTQTLADDIPILYWFLIKLKSIIFQWN